jgi:hypothetical protein
MKEWRMTDLYFSRIKALPNLRFAIDQVITNWDYVVLDARYTGTSTH